MTKNVKINVVGHRLIDNGRIVEDITKVDLPSVEHYTTEISKISGMVMDVNMPSPYRLKAMEFGIAHNNGNHCSQLSDPGRHQFEFRIVRQDYINSEGAARNESVKYRLLCNHVSTEDGSVEMDNPLGSTEKYSVLRFEKEIDGEIVTCIDALGGTLKWNGVEYRDDVESLLS